MDVCIVLRMSHGKARCIINRTEIGPLLEKEAAVSNLQREGISGSQEANSQGFLRTDLVFHLRVLVKQAISFRRHRKIIWGGMQEVEIRKR